MWRGMTNLPKPTVSAACCHTLVDLGYAETDGRQFQLAPAVLSLAAAYLRFRSGHRPCCSRFARR